MTEEKRGVYPGRRLSRRRRPAAIDNFLIKLAVGFVAVLFFSQCLLLSDSTRHFFSMVDRMEGDKISFSTDLAASDEAAPGAGIGGFFRQTDKMTERQENFIRHGIILLKEFIKEIY